jgi:hypothetical protein
MSIEQLRPDPFLDALVADLGAVEPRRPAREAALVLALVITELLLFVALGDMRPDLPQVMLTPGFWWKAGGLVGVGGLATAAMLVGLDPATTTSPVQSRLWRGLALVAPLGLALGWLLDAGQSAQVSPLARLDWREGVDCLVNVGLLAAPPAILFAALLRRGAPTQPARAAAAAGIGAGGLGAFIFAFHCPHDDPLYVAVWYGGAIAIAAGLARLALPRLARW